MPTFDIKDRVEGPGWGCNCRAFRLGEPAPEKALAALALSAKRTVTVEFRREDGDGTLHFVAWTKPENRYNVTYDPHRPGGWCKHIIACLVHWAPWHRRLALDAAEALEEIGRLTKEIKRLEREAKKRDREIAKLRS